MLYFKRGEGKYHFALPGVAHPRAMAHAATEPSLCDVRGDVPPLQRNISPYRIRNRNCIVDQRAHAILEALIGKDRDASGEIVKRRRAWSFCYAVVTGRTTKA